MHRQKEKARYPIPKAPPNKICARRGGAGVGDVARQPGISDQTVFNGVVRPGHAVPEQHLWSVNDPSVGPTSGWVRGRGVRYE